MSKYTTEVRYICEQKSGMGNGGFAAVDAILDMAWDKVFTTKAETFDPAYKPVICKKVLKHYYTREIGAETAGLWQLWMNTRFEEIIGYYNEMYKSAQISFDPLQDTDLTTDHKRDSEDNETKSGNRSLGEKADTTGSRNETRNLDGENEGTEQSNTKLHDISKDVNTASIASNNLNWDKYSETPQGAVTGIESDTYLTNARKVTDENKQGSSGESDHDATSTGDNSAERSGKFSEDETKGTTEEKKLDRTLQEDTTGDRQLKTTEDYVQHIVGKRGSMTYSKMIQEYRDTLINIDLKFIAEFSDLFMNLW